MSEVFLKTKPKVLLVRKNLEAKQIGIMGGTFNPCLLYTSDAADDYS